MTRLDRGVILDAKELPHTKDGIAELLRLVPTEETIVLEAGTYAKGLYRALTKAGRRVVMAHPSEVRRHAPRRKKSDPVDSHELAKQHELGLIRPCHVPSPAEDELRSLVRHRIDVGNKSTRIKNQVQALLGRCGVHHEYEEEKLFTRAGLRFLERVQVNEAEARILEFHLRELAFLRKEQDEVDRGLAELAKQREDVALLMSIPGVDYYGALVVLAELGNPRRFPSEKHVASYAGLVPRLHESGASQKHTSIHREGPAYLRWIAVCLTTTVILRPENQTLRLFFKRVQRRAGSGAQGRNKAKVATARKLLIVMWRMLLTGKPYEEARASLTEQKVKRMRGRARSLPKASVSAAAEELGRILPEKDQSSGGGSST